MIHAKELYQLTCLFSPKEILNTLGVFPITPIVLDSVAESL